MFPGNIRGRASRLPAGRRSLTCFLLDPSISGSSGMKCDNRARRGPSRATPFPRSTIAFDSTRGSIRLCSHYVVAVRYLAGRPRNPSSDHSGQPTSSSRTPMLALRRRPSPSFFWRSSSPPLRVLSVSYPSAPCVGLRFLFILPLSLSTLAVHRLSRRTPLPRRQRWFPLHTAYPRPPSPF